MGISITIKFIPDGKERISKKDLFNVAGVQQVGEELIFYNVDGTPIFKILASELVSIDFIQ